MPVMMGMIRREPFDGLRAGGERVGLEQVVEEGAVLFPQLVGLIDGGEAILVVIKHDARSYILSRGEHLSRLLQLLIDLIQGKLAVERDVGGFHYLLGRNRVSLAYRLAWQTRHWHRV